MSVCVGFKGLGGQCVVYLIRGISEEGIASPHDRSPHARAHVDSRSISIEAHFWLCDVQACDHETDLGEEIV